MTVLKVSLWARRPRRRYFVLGEVDAADEIPEKLPRKALVVVRQPGRPTWLAFDCPCKGRHRLLVNLDPRRRPFWRLSRGPHGPSVSPSIDYRVPGSRCHFVVRDGRIRWF